MANRRKTDKLYEWLVIGGGPHGVHTVACLVSEGVSSSNILLLDRYSEPLYMWKQQTSRLDMGHLRSSAVHHLGPSPWSLVDFAQRRFGHPRNWSAPPYQRPAYDVFQMHCEHIVEKYLVGGVFLQRDVARVERDESGGYAVETDDGRFRSKRIVLAVGQPPPRIPAWAAENPKVQHLLSPDWRDVEGRVAVVGGGMTACQFCLAHHHQFEKTTLVAPALPQLSDFDADPCWIGPKCRTPEFESSSVESKRQVIADARRPGSVNSSVFERLENALQEERIDFRQGRVVGLHGDRLLLSSGETIEIDEVVLGTGFQSVRPGGAFVDTLIESLALPTSPCGYPELTPDLEWTEGLYVTGGLAELRLGPVSRNITGARSAAKLILEHALKSKESKKAVLV